MRRTNGAWSVTSIPSPAPAMSNIASLLLLPTCTNPHECTRPTAEPTPSPTPIDCNGPFHPSCFTTTPSPTPEPTTRPPPTTRPSDRTPTFGSTTIANITATVNAIGVDEILPTASGGNGTLRYSLSGTLPDGVSFNSRTRRLLGVPSVTQGAVSYTYTATDADGDTASLRFTITVDPEPIRPPPSPKGLSASVVRDSCDREHCDVAFTWPFKSGYSQYKIYYSHHRSGANAPRHFDGQWIGTVSGSATSFTKTNLDCDYNYQFRSRAQGDGVTYTTTWSSYGNPANVVARCTDSPQPPPVSPQPPGGNAPVDSNTITNGGADLFEVTITSTPPTANPENHWPMFEARELGIEITGRNGGDLPAGYTTFRLKVDPDDTGLQSRGTTVCDFSGMLLTTAVDINPPKALVPVVRCGRGKPSSDADNEGITIEAVTPSGRVLTIFTLPVNEAVHRPAGQLTYWVDPPNMFPADVAGPAGVLPAIPPAFANTTVYAQGAQAWNRALNGYPAPVLSQATSSSGAGIVIQGYRAGDSINHCGSSVACTSWAGTPPDLGNGQPFWLRATPQSPRAWTNNYTTHADNDGDFAYLPWTVAHEFGHTIGLGHSKQSNVLMSGYGVYDDYKWEFPAVGAMICASPDTPKCGLTAEDVNGARAIYPQP